MDKIGRLVQCVSIILLCQLWAASGQEYPPRVPKFHRGGEVTKVYTPGTKDYDRAWYTVDDRYHFFFSVQSCGTAYLALSETTGTSGEYTMEIALGMEGNTHSALSFINEVGSLYRAPTKDILHCNEFRQFWIRWDRGWIEVGHGPLLGDQTFINYYDPFLMRYIVAIGLASEVGYSALWNVKENSGHFLMFTTPDMHRYDQVWKSVQNRFFMDFVVIACGHVHVLLAAQEGQTTTDVYEFVIGGWNNTQSVLRTEIFGGHKAMAMTPEILDCSRQKEFWISWVEGTFAMGQGGVYGENMILSWIDPNPTPVRYLAITTGFGASGRWFLYEDKEEVNYLFTEPGDGSGMDVYDKYWIESPSRMSAFFAVSTCTDARVLLSEYDGLDSEFDIEVIIGAENNTKITMGYVTEIGPLAETYVARPLDCIHPETFWMDWLNGTIRIGKGITPGTFILLQKQVLVNNQFKFKAYALATPTTKGVWRFRESNGERLLVKTPNYYNHYKQAWRSVPHKDYFQFRLKACHDGHVALAPTPGVMAGETYLDLVFGGWGNQRSVISRLKGDNIVGRDYISEFAETPDMMQCGRHLDLWVSWKDDMLQIGKGSLVGHHVLTSASMDRSYPINYVGMSTGWGASGEWFVEEDNGDMLTFYMPEKAWIAVDIDITWVRFYLRGCTDAVVWVTSVDGATGIDYYEIGIGSEGNTKSYIKLQFDLKVEMDTPDILDCENNYPFWVSWNDGLVEVGRGFIYGIRRFMSWQDPRPFVVLGVALTSKDPNMWGRYQIQENVGYYSRFETPTNYQYHTAWRSTEHAQSTVFEVKACSDAHVLLSSSIRTEDNMYEVVIGGWHNTRSAVRTYMGPIHTSHYRDNLLSCVENRHFWISWADDTIEVGLGEVVGRERVLEYHPLQMYEVRGVGYSTGYSYNGTWAIKLWQGIIPIGPPVTPGPDETTPPPLDSSGGLNGGQIAGVVIGAIGAVVLVGLIIVSMVFMRQGKDIPLLPANGEAGSGAMDTSQTNGGHDNPAESTRDSSA